MKSTRLFHLIIAVASLVLLQSAAAAEETFSFTLNTDAPSYHVGDEVIVYATCKNGTNSEVVLRGNLVPLKGIAYGSNIVTSWDGKFIGKVNPPFNYFAPPVTQFFKPYVHDVIQNPNGTGVQEVRIPARSSVVFAQTRFDKVFATEFYPPSDVTPLPVGKYIIDVTLFEVQTTLGTFRDIELSTPLKIVPPEPRSRPRQPH